VKDDHRDGEKGQKDSDPAEKVQTKNEEAERATAQIQPLITSHHIASDLILLSEEGRAKRGAERERKRKRLNPKGGTGLL